MNPRANQTYRHQGVTDQVSDPLHKVMCDVVDPGFLGGRDNLLAGKKGLLPLLLLLRLLQWPPVHDSLGAGGTGGRVGTPSQSGVYMGVGG